MNARTTYALIFTLAAVAIVGWVFAFIGLPFLHAEITLNQGLTKQEVIAAFGDEAVRKAKGIQNILLFTKSGGSLEIGNIQPNLRVDSEVKVDETKQVNFQYFVDTKDDLTGPSIYHCTDIKLHVFLDGKKVYVTEWLGYEGGDPTLDLNTEIITINSVTPGIHIIGLMPEGRTTGCNIQGYILSWAGMLVIYD